MTSGRINRFVVLLILIVLLPVASIAGQEDPFLQPDEFHSISIYAPADVPEKLKKAQEENNIEAQYVLGYMYFYGKGVKQDKVIGIKLMEKAAQGGNSDAMYVLSHMQREEGNTTSSVDWLFKSAKEKNPKAWYQLGKNHETGYGVFTDMEKAKKWYEAADAADVINAHIKLAFFYLNGIGVDKDVPKAITMIEEIEPKVDKTTQVRIAQLLAELYSKQSGGQVDENVFKWQKKMAEYGDEQSQFGLAEAYFQGAGVKQDYKEAIYWYEKSAARMNAIAMTRLGYIYANGFGVAVDYKKAVEWYTKAADNGNSEAAWNLGNLYAGGHGVEKNPEEAYNWFARADYLRKREKERLYYGY